MPGSHRPLFALTLMIATLAVAPRVGHAQTPEEIQMTSERLAREIPCVREQHERLGNTLRLLEEAQRQTTMSAPDSAARRDAVHAAEALELRLGVIVGDLRACLGQASSGASATTTAQPGAGGVSSSGTHSTSTSHEVVVSSQDATHPAEHPNPATEVVARDVRLQPNLRLVQAERVDGEGRSNPEEVRAAVERVSPRIDACYEQLSERSALQRGRAYLTFTVTPDRRVRDIRLENFTIYDRAFQRCVGAAVGRLYVQEGAEGGNARYSFQLEFGPQDAAATPPTALP